MMSDKIALVLLYIVIAFNAVFVWMRLRLIKRGQEYKYVNGSWRVFHAYIDQMSSDKKLKFELMRFVVVDCTILISVSVLTLTL
ncbi:hypothetical protein [Mangrovibacterium diazotrophicum]|uniref:Uncharacterized protein n=1 Tax=Mangrovibacterium diazotrophicum TaxID=1261403 RepID=A0A419VVB9_9BACT|nr:hypothetical protein [Mangrovibacterium diazotrophicum]RKD86071.1 hypothetical protein BC643_4387 [Mangrovibacterium diazotrophicum]